MRRLIAAAVALVGAMAISAGAAVADPSSPPDEVTHGTGSLPLEFQMPCPGFPTGQVNVDAPYRYHLKWTGLVGVGKYDVRATWTDAGLSYELHGKYDILYTPADEEGPGATTIKRSDGATISSRNTRLSLDFIAIPIVFRVSWLESPTCK